MCCRKAFWAVCGSEGTGSGRSGTRASRGSLDGKVAVRTDLAIMQGGERVVEVCREVVAFGTAEGVAGVTRLVEFVAGDGSVPDLLQVSILGNLEIRALAGLE